MSAIVAFVAAAVAALAVVRAAPTGLGNASIWRSPPAPAFAVAAVAAAFALTSAFIAASIVVGASLSVPPSAPAGAAVVLAFVGVVAAFAVDRREIEVVRPPGVQIQALAEFLLPRKTYTTIFEPILRDLQDEHIEALAEGRIWKARWVVLRGWISFWAGVVDYLSGFVVKLAIFR